MLHELEGLSGTDVIQDDILSEGFITRFLLFSNLISINLDSKLPDEFNFISFLSIKLMFSLMKKTVPPWVVSVGSNMNSL